MKRVERHHLKEDELKRLVRHARGRLEDRGRETTYALVAVLIVGLPALGYYAWHQRVQNRSQALLAQAVAVQGAPVATPSSPAVTGGFPNERARAEAAIAKFKATADSYPSTDAGIFARYQEAVTWMTLGNAAQAAAAYEEVVRRAGDGIYGQMARLGVAEAQARGGKYDQAINTFKELAQKKDGPLPVDGILMQLGRAYLSAGKRSDAEQTFNRLLAEYPQSAYTTEAKRELDSLKKA